MSFLSDSLKEVAIPDALLVFKETYNQVAVQKVYFSECRPVAAYHTDDSPVEIFVPNQGNEYIDLQRSRLYVKARIVRADGSVLSQGENTGIINLPLQSLWSQIDVYANNKLVSLHGSHYPWKAYLKTILSLGTNAVKTQLLSQLFSMDSANFDDQNAFTGTNRGLAARYRLTKLSHIFDMEGPIYEDVFTLNRYLVNGVDLYLKLFRNRAAFLLMSGEDAPSYKVELLDVVFKACMIKIDEGVLLSHANIFEDRTAKYPLTRTEIKMNSVPAGSGSFIWQNVYSNNLPQKVFFVFVEQSAVNGNYTKNPFNFQNIADGMGLYVNGESVPARPMQMDLSINKNYVTPYVNLIETCDRWNKDEGFAISRDMFDKGCAIYGFNLAPGDYGGDYINLIRHGNLRLEVKFATPTTETYNCLAYAEFPALLEIDRTRDVKFTRV
ncbi:hypothetical protein [Solemya velum gill symbiont]|uniref:Uncharacterized protein n=1 Tax=Solemya velum gill symbiont TaxID=2340 RepID=A0A0B0H4E4_SOVGS|nr:hypothetical protein [Solemya velum gill symbiont]KHF23990.1 hypothetical protein JV46_29740 [Solemya velum gill symbiont]OOZ07837.1 hypothetical protein BOW24_11465 [Solemya velum gill symbiont]OOZ21461.1 hypothetical protein BOW31_12690 [Solemya velum gill symbiont]